LGSSRKLWVRTSFWRNYGGRNKAMYFASCYEFDVGNIVNYPPSIAYLVHPDPTKHVVWDIRPNKGTSYIDLEFEGVDEKSLTLRVLSMENLPIKV